MDSVADLRQNSYHGLPACWDIISSCRLSICPSSYCDLNFFAKDWLQIFFWLLTAVQDSIITITLIVVSLLVILCPSAENLLFFLDFSWIVLDLPYFSEVRSFTSWYSFLAVVSVQASINILALGIYPVLFRFLHGLLNLPVTFLPSISLAALVTAVL